MKANKFLIVGLDPGVTTGLCILDLDGNLIHSESSRNLDVKEIIKKISQHGIPVLIACDVSQAPKLVERVAAKFQAKIFTPVEDLSIKLKKTLTRGMKIKNDHERDAIASAFLAFRRNRSLFEKVEKELSHLDKAERDLVKKKLLLGEIPSVKAYIEEKEKVGEEKKPRKRKKAPEVEKLIASLKAELRSLQLRVEELEEENRKLRNLVVRIPKPSKDVKELKSEVNYLRGKVKELLEALDVSREEINRYKKEIEVLKKGYLIVREFDELSEDVKKFEGDVLFIKRIRGLDEKFLDVLKRFPLIITSSIDVESEKILSDHRISVVLEKYIKLERISGLLCVKKDEVEKKKKVKEVFKEIIEDYRKERKTAR